MRPVEVPIYSFTTHQREEATRHVEPADVVIIEGILVLHMPQARPSASRSGSHSARGKGQSQPRPAELLGHIRPADMLKTGIAAGEMCILARPCLCTSAGALGLCTGAQPVCDRPAAVAAGHVSFFSRWSHIVLANQVTRQSEALAAPQVLELLDMRIYVDTDDDVRLARRCALCQAGAEVCL